MRQMKGASEGATKAAGMASEGGWRKKERKRKQIIIRIPIYDATTDHRTLKAAQRSCIQLYTRNVQGKGMRFKDFYYCGC